MAKKLSDTSCCPNDCPEQGDVFVCDECKCTVLTVKSCCSTDPDCVCLACCGKAMTKAN